MRALVLLLALAVTAAAQEPSIETVMAAVARFAGGFDSAAGWVAEETMTERGFEAPKRHGLHAGFTVTTEKPEMVSRELTTRYGFTSDPAIHEVRELAAVDGHPQREDRQRFEAAIRDGNKAARRRLQEEFDRASIDVAATDFGPLILLFTKGRQPDCEFYIAGTALIGAETVLLVRYKQTAGAASLHLKDGAHEGSVALSGQIEVRESDFAPLRITMVSARRDIRDEAEVDYVPQPSGLLLPVSIVYRRYVQDALVAEDRSRFSAWHKLGAPGAER